MAAQAGVDQGREVDCVTPMLRVVWSHSTAKTQGALLAASNVVPLTSQRRGELPSTVHHRASLLHSTAPPARCSAAASQHGTLCSHACILDITTLMCSRCALPQPCFQHWCCSAVGLCSCQCGACQGKDAVHLQAQSTSAVVCTQASNRLELVPEGLVVHSC